MASNTNEDYLDSLLQSILNMEESTEDSKDESTDDSTEDSQDDSTDSSENKSPQDDLFSNELNTPSTIDDILNAPQQSNTTTDEISTTNAISIDDKTNYLDAMAAYTDDKVNEQNDLQDVDVSDMEALLRFVAENRESSDEDESEPSMSEDEIEQLLERNKKFDSSVNTDIPSPYDDQPIDLTAINNPDWDDIQSLLQKSDQNEIIEDTHSFTNDDSREEEPYQTSDLYHKGSLKEKKPKKKKKPSKRKSGQTQPESSQSEADSEERNQTDPIQEEPHPPKHHRAKKPKTDKPKVNKFKTDKQKANQQKADQRKSRNKKQSKKDDRSIASEQKSKSDLSFDSLDLNEQNPFTNFDFSLDSNESQEIPLFGAKETTDLLTGDKTQKEKSQKKNNKKSFWAKLSDLLWEEEEEPTEPSASKGSAPKDKSKKKKTKKTNKPQKGGKVSGKNQNDDDEEIIEKKSSKPKKPAKEKAPVAAVETAPSPKLSKKKIGLVAAVCVTFGLAVLLLSFLATQVMNRTKAREAYLQGDFARCYTEFYHMRRNEDEEYMFRRSEYILRSLLPLKTYQMYMEMGDRVRALDQLIQFTFYYPVLQKDSLELNVTNEFQSSYQSALTLLFDQFGLTQEQALDIANQPDDLIYTRMVTAVANGENYEIWRSDELPNDEVSDDGPPYENMLPEEEGLPTTNFFE
ncbi:MAG: hypothetical protein LBM69_10705 [Lachnospiraceae bacterium]|jgi:hypothetical protein|nr:hypothetical protein [Lachnospiraceae bacterium]